MKFLGSAEASRYMEVTVHVLSGAKALLSMDRLARPLFILMLLLVSQTYHCYVCFTAGEEYSNCTCYIFRQASKKGPMHCQHDGVTLLTQHKQIH